MPTKINDLGLEWPWPVECDVCKEAFTPSKFANRSTRFCSRSCLERDRWENRRDREAKRASDRRYGMRPANRETRKTRSAAWRAEAKQKPDWSDKQLGYYLKWRFGITLADYQAMVEAQDGKCAICGTTDTAPRDRLSVDHCHATGKVRALLCHLCNSGLGSFKDDVDAIERAAAYLRSHAT